MSNGLLNFDNKFCHVLQNSQICIFILQCVWNFGILDKLFLKTKDSLNKWNVILIYYVIDFLKSQQL
jgi:hypothetical protein